MRETTTLSKSTFYFEQIYYSTKDEFLYYFFNTCAKKVYISDVSPYCLLKLKIQVNNVQFLNISYFISYQQHFL